MKRIALSALTFIAIAGFFALIAWLSGFNFDHRGPNVGEASLYVLILAIGAVALVWSLSDE